MDEPCSRGGRAEEAGPPHGYNTAAAGPPGPGAAGAAAIGGGGNTRSSRSDCSNTRSFQSGNTGRCSGEWPPRGCCSIILSGICSRILRMEAGSSEYCSSSAAAPAPRPSSTAAAARSRGGRAEEAAAAPEEDRSRSRGGRPEEAAPAALEEDSWSRARGDGRGRGFGRGFFCIFFFFNPGTLGMINCDLGCWSGNHSSATYQWRWSSIGEPRAISGGGPRSGNHVLSVEVVLDRDRGNHVLSMEMISEDRGNHVLSVEMIPEDRGNHALSVEVVLEDRGNHVLSVEVVLEDRSTAVYVLLYQYREREVSRETEIRSPWQWEKIKNVEVRLRTPENNWRTSVENWPKKKTLRSSARCARTRT